MKQNTLILCESIIIEKDTNKISLIGLFNRVIVDRLPVSFPRFSILSRFENGNGQHDHKIIIKYEESGEILAELPGKIDFKENEITQFIGNFMGVKFFDFGKYKIEIYIDDKLQPISTYIELIKR